MGRSKSIIMLSQFHIMRPRPSLSINLSGTGDLVRGAGVAREAPAPGGYKLC